MARRRNRSHLLSIKYRQHEGAAFVPLSNGHEAVIAIEKLEVIRRYLWCYHAEGYAYAYSSTDVNTRRVLLMHRVIAEAPGNKVVDHLDGNKLNNRIANLRITTQVVNGQNRHRNNANNKSGVTGVSWDNSRQKWVACIRLNYKSITLGRFTSFDDAVAARKNAERLHFTP